MNIIAESHSPQFETNACDQCYRTKQTCTKNIPQCQRCQKSSTSCTYSFGKFMGKPKRRLKSRQQQQCERGTNRQTTSVKEHETHGQSEAKGYSASIGPYRTRPDLVGSSLESEHAADNIVLVNKQSASISLPNPNGRGKKRALNLSACDQCYRFKVKCVPDGDLCQRCTGNKSVCTYSIGSAPEKEDGIDPRGSGSAAKRRRLSLVEQQASIEMNTEKRHSDADPHSARWAGAREISVIHTVEEGVMDKSYLNDSIVNSARQEPNHPPAGIRRDDQDQSSSISLNTGDATYDFFGQGATVYSDISAWSPITYQSSNFDLLCTNYQAPPLEQSFTQNNNHIIHSSDYSPTLSQKPDHEPECSCILSALSTLSKLHELDHLSASTNESVGLDSILSTAHDSLLICENVIDCKSSTYMMLMLCITILQQIVSCYNMLSSSTYDSHGSLSLSIKIGDVQCYEGLNVPGMMQAILSGENKRAKEVCDRLLNVCRQSGDLDYGNELGSVGGTTGYDCLRKLLGLLKQKFVL